MKLIDLLVKELPKRGGWPAFASVCWSYPDGEIRFDNDTARDFYPSPDFVNGDDRACSIGNSSNGITREQYEAALAASKAVVGNDGWIQLSGGECPVDSDAIVEVKYRKPNQYQFNNDRAGDFTWSHDGFGGDIIAYRLQQSTKSEQACDDAAEADDEADLNECIGQDVDVVNHPSHYNKGRIECIDAIDSATVGKTGIEAVAVANIIKYLWRYEEKGGLESVRKAQWYLNKLISELESK